MEEMFPITFLSQFFMQNYLVISHFCIFQKFSYSSSISLLLLEPFYYYTYWYFCNQFLQITKLVIFMVLDLPIACHIFEKSSISWANTTDWQINGASNFFLNINWQGISFPITFLLSMQKNIFSGTFSPYFWTKYL